MEKVILPSLLDPVDQERLRYKHHLKVYTKSNKAWGRWPHWSHESFESFWSWFFISFPAFKEGVGSCLHITWKCSRISYELILLNYSKEKSETSKQSNFVKWITSCAADENVGLSILAGTCRSMRGFGILCMSLPSLMT